MELLSNLAWFAVAVSLWGWWSVRRRSARKGPFVQDASAELIALVMLTAILLPAISITDDLHACQLPAEIRRSVLQSDRRLTPAAPPGILPFTLALLALLMSSLKRCRIAYLAAERPASLPPWSYVPFLWGRPPPAATA